jgi:hypothetical protein
MESWIFYRFCVLNNVTSLRKHEHFIVLYMIPMIKLKIRETWNNMKIERHFTFIFDVRSFPEFQSKDFAACVYLTPQKSYFSWWFHCYAVIIFWILNKIEFVHFLKLGCDIDSRCFGLFGTNVISSNVSKKVCTRKKAK